MSGCDGFVARRFKLAAGFVTGNVTISGGVSLSVNSSLNGPTPQFTLTCVSTGGPATTVTWTRDSVTFTRGTETVLVDPATAQYTHTLTVSGRPEGLYTCTVSNSKPSEDSAQLNIAGKPTKGAEFQSIFTPQLCQMSPRILRPELAREKLCSLGLLHPSLNTVETSPTTPSPVPPPPPRCPSLGPSQWLGSLPTLSTPVQWQLTTAVALDLLPSLHSPHWKTVSTPTPQCSNLTP